MSKTLLLVCLLFAGSLRLCASVDYSVLWQKGTTYFQQKQYDSAAYYFEQIAALKPQNAEVYYNLGNTYYRLNRIAPAILNYERALQINPDYKEAKDNLALAENRISNHIHQVNDIFFIKWWRSLTSTRTATVWATLSLVSFCLFIIVLLARRLQKAGRKSLPTQLPGVLMFLFICFLGLAYTAANRTRADISGVVMENDAPLMNTDLRGKPLTLVPEGTVVHILDEKSGWNEVQLPDGRTGWLQKNLLARI